MKPTEQILELAEGIKNELKYLNDIVTPILNESYPNPSHVFSGNCENAIYIDINNMLSGIDTLKFIAEEIKKQLPELPEEKSFLNYLNKSKQ